MIDYHTHTKFNDGANTVDEMIEAAISLNMKEIGISDHFGYFPTDGSNSFCIFITIEDYFKDLNRVKDKYKDKIKVKATLELDTYLENVHEMTSLINSFHPDYILGGIHQFNGIGYSHQESFKEITDYDYEVYLEELIKIVKTGTLDIMAHYFDYKTYYPFKDESRFYDYYKELAQALQDNNCIPEMNTSCFNTSFLGTKFKEDPNLFFWKECAKRDIPVIITSDSHDVPYFLTIAYSNYFRAKEILQRAGVKYTATFTDRKMSIEEIKY